MYKIKNSKKIGILGAGISGLSTGIALAKNGFDVEIYEKRSRVGSFFKKDVHSLRNYSYDNDVLEQYKELGINLSIFCPVFKEIRYTPSLKKIEIYSNKKPLFYNFLRGYKDKNSLDNALLESAKDSGVKIKFNQDIKDNDKNIDVIATGASSIDYVGYGAHYKIKSDKKIDSIHYFLDDHYAPKGYIYILPFLNEFSLVLATTKIKDKDQLKKNFNEFRKNNIVKEILKETEFVNEIFGFASFKTNKNIKGKKMFIGEAASFLDASTGFGTHYAIISGCLAAKSVIEEKNYYKLCEDYFGEELEKKRLKRKKIEKMNLDQQEKNLCDLINKHGKAISIDVYKKIKESN